MVCNKIPRDSKEANERCDLLGGRLPVISSVKENTDIFHSVVGPEAEVCFSSLLSLSNFKFVDPPPSRYSQGWVGGAVLELRQISQKIFGSVRLAVNGESTNRKIVFFNLGFSLDFYFPFLDS